MTYAAPVRPTTSRAQFVSPHLDRNALRSGVAARRQVLVEVEGNLVSACEHAAAQGATRCVRIDDRATWDAATWERYLAAALRLEPDYAPRLRRLYQEIEQLDRLIALPLAA